MGYTVKMTDHGTHPPTSVHTKPKHLRALVTVLAGLTLHTGCKSTPPAPETFDELTSYMFEHFEDEDPAALQEGMHNLRNWLCDHFEETQEGYMLENLSEDAVATLDGQQTNLDGQIGAGAAYDITYPIEDIIRVYLDEDQFEVHPNDYETYERSWIDGENCFTQQECEFAYYHSHVENNFALGLSLEAWNAVQYRWVELDDGPSLLMRSWMRKPAVSNFDWFEIDQQFGFGAIWSADHGIRQLEAGWVIMSLGELEIPLDMALRLTVNTILERGVEVQDYLDEEE